MVNAGVERDRDGDVSPGPVHRSHARELGAVLWGLAVVTIAVIGRYATIGRIQATIQESWLPLVQVIVVVAVFGLVAPVFTVYIRRTDFPE